MPVIYRPTPKFVPKILEGTPTRSQQSPNTAGANPAANQLRGDSIAGVAQPAPYSNATPQTSFNTKQTSYAPGQYPGSMNDSSHGVMDLDHAAPETP